MKITYSVRIVNPVKEVLKVTNDIGATGYSQKAIDDSATYIIDKDNTAKRFPQEFEQISPISDYGIAPENVVYFDSLADAQAVGYRTHQ